MTNSNETFQNKTVVTTNVLVQRKFRRFSFKL